MEFAAPMPPNKPEIEAHISNDSSISAYCRFAQVVHSMPPLEGFDVDFDLGVKQFDDSPSDGPRERRQCVLGPGYEDEGPAARIVKMVPSTKEVQYFVVKLLTLKEHFLGGNPSFLSFSLFIVLIFINFCSYIYE